MSRKMCPLIPSRGFSTEVFGKYGVEYGSTATAGRLRPPATVRTRPGNSDPSFFAEFQMCRNIGDFEMFRNVWNKGGGQQISTATAASGFVTAFLYTFALSDVHENCKR